MPSHFNILKSVLIPNYHYLENIGNKVLVIFGILTFTSLLKLALFASKFYCVFAVVCVMGVIYSEL